MSDYDIKDDAIPALVEQLEAHGMIALGEHKGIDLATSETVLQLAL